MTNKNKIVLAIMVLAGLGIFAYSMRDVSLHSMVGDIAEMKWGWLIIGFLCMAVSLLFEAFVVQKLIHRKLPSFPFKDAIRVPLVEQLFNGITPFSSGGQPGQLFVLVQSGVDGGRATSILLMKFIVYQAMIVVNFILCLIIGFHLIAAKLHALAWLVVMGFLIHFAVIVSLLMIMYWYSFTKKLVQWAIKPVKWFKKDLYTRWSTTLNEKMDNFYQESLELKKDRKLLLKISLLTLVQLGFYYIIPFFILLALGVNHVNLILVTTLHVLIVMVISLFPIPGGAVGAEYSFSMIFTTFISSNSKLVLAMMLWRLITYYLPMFSGMVALAISPQKVNNNSKES